MLPYQSNLGCFVCPNIYVNAVTFWTALAHFMYWWFLTKVLLSGMDTLGRFSVVFYKGDNTFTSCFPFWIPNPFSKGAYSKRKEFAPIGSKFFPFRVDHFFKKCQNNFDRVASLEIFVTTPLKCVNWFVKQHDWIITINKVHWMVKPRFHWTQG